ncbi:MAG: hypothetical protein DMD81_15870 [Candidatus Rokuibacteriota bacterium]|nr:MAG: hypothetical protein DMD81_15870 [Candidatus Rokubacteria bacterium]
MLVWICLAELGALSLWFSATAIVPMLSVQWMSPAANAWLSMAVTLGFVVGTAASTLFTLADALGARRLFAFAALLGAAANAGLLPLIDSLPLVLTCRFVTGLAAQFSTSVSELAPREYVGTALSLQTSIGFLLTLASTRLVPVMADAWGWASAFLFLAPGPFLGTLAMWALRRLPEAKQLALGRR